MTTAHTFVITVENAVDGDTAAMLAALRKTIRDTATQQGFRIVPCGWAPDADTIADNIDADEVEVHDLNPARVPDLGEPDGPSLRESGYLN